MEIVDIDMELWESIKEAAAQSPWIPEEYYMNDWVADVRAFLLYQKPPNKGKFSELLDPQCIFCGYNGPGYYQAHTHKKDCPFYEIGGAEREHALVVFAKKGWLQFCKTRIPVNEVKS